MSDGLIEPRCEALTRKGRRCKNQSCGRHNGLNLCGPHKRQSEAVFADAEKRWKDALERCRRTGV